jgi:hypothetical protein
MDRTRPAQLIPGGFAGNEANELEDVGQRNPGPDCGEVNARHGWSLIHVPADVVRFAEVSRRETGLITFRGPDSISGYVYQDRIASDHQSRRCWRGSEGNREEEPVVLLE